MKKKLAKLVLAITLFVSSLLFTGCDSLLERAVDRIFGKQVPVYQGMSITQVITPTATTVSYMSAMPCDAENGNKDNNGKHNGWYKGDHCGKDDELDKENPFPDNTENENIENEIQDSLDVIGAGKEIYYASVGEDIYVNIHISNPDGFEIQSFTLNGKKYANYMFEDGSTMEMIILKYNVGWESGIYEYTIDAIKYIDGTEIKDVKMSGDKTVRAGVRRENQVSATISNLEIGFNDISLNVNIADEDNLIEYSQGELKAVLYDGETLVATKDLTVGENEVSFNGLKTNGLYQYAIVGYYDNLENGFGLNVLQKEAFYTQAIVLFDNITITPDGISYSLFWHETYANESLLSLKLYQGETFVKELSTTTTEVNGLSATNEYTLIAEYKKDSASEKIALTFTLPTKATPTATLSLGEIGTNSVSFTVAETDIDNAGAIEKIQITNSDGDSMIVTDLTAQEITDLKSNTQYTLKVTYTYDTGDGSGAHEFVLSETFYTNLGDTPIIYEKVEDEYIVTGVVNKSITRAVIEDDIAGIPVTKIAKNTFSDCASLTDLVMGKNISSIGSYTFYNCFELTNIYILAT